MRPSLYTAADARHDANSFHKADVLTVYKDLLTDIRNAAQFGSTSVEVVVPIGYTTDIELALRQLGYTTQVTRYEPFDDSSTIKIWW